MGQGRGAEASTARTTAARAGRWSTPTRRLGLDVRVHPKNPDVVFVGNIAAYRSDDGGKTWTSIKGAPGGDDYQRIWINPLQPDIMLFTADQGAVVTVNGGRTWSSWYNQPTAQFYHVTTDNQFPYWVYGGQQESGAIGIASRGNGGQISFRDWIGVGADEYGYVAPDPLDPNIVYGGRVMRFDRRTGQAQNVAPEALRSGKYRILRTMPLLFHPGRSEDALLRRQRAVEDDHRRRAWDIISPDLSRERPEVPREHRRLPHAGTGDDAAPRRHLRRRAVAKDVNIIWAGTDDGLVHVTRDGGKTWTERDAAGAARMGQGVADRRRPLRREHRLRRRSTRSASTTCGRTSTARTTAAAPGRGSSAASPRWARSTSSARTRSSRDCCSPAPSGRCMFSFDDGEQLAAAADEHAGLVHPRPGDQGRRPGDRHARAVDLDPRRRHAACGSSPRRREPAAAISVHARRGPRACAGTCSPTRRCRPKSRRARTRPTARFQLLPAARARKTVTLEIFDADGRARPPLFERRRAGAHRPEHAAVPDLLDPAAAAVADAPGTTVSCGTCATRRRAARGALTRSRRLCATRRAARSVRSSIRGLHGAPDGRRASVRRGRWRCGSIRA